MASSMLTAEVSASASKEADVDEALKSALHLCANDPDFAVICDFLQKFSKDLGLDLPNFKLLLQWLTKTDEVSPQLREMQIKLLRKTRKTVHEKSWESALSKFCFSYSAQDAWEVERFGYKNSSVKVKLRILRELLECQFERNNKFRAKILTLSADSLRSQPIGRDTLGHAYWVTQDNDCNIRIYQEHLDEEIWQVVATTRDEFVNLIKRLKGNEVVLPSTDIGIIDEDTSSSSSSRIDSDYIQKEPPPEEKDDSQDEEQKVPKLSIKLVTGKGFEDTINKKELGKGEEELAAEEDAKLLKKSNNVSEANDSGEEEFEEVEEEYEDEEETGSEAESDDDEDDEVEDVKNISKEKNNESDQKSQISNKTKEDAKKVKPLLISQNKVVKNDICSISNINTAKKRGLDQVEPNSPPQNEKSQLSALKKSRPSLIDSKRVKSTDKYDDSQEGEENYEDESGDDDDDVEEEIEEEDIDSVAAEEDENEEKQFDDDDDDDDEEDEVGKEISDPVVRVTGEGSGKDCDGENYMFCIDMENVDEISVSDEIVEEVCYFWGEGNGKECLVGNNDADNSTNAANKNESEILKTTLEIKSKSKINISLTQEENKIHLKASTKNSVPKDGDEAKTETTKLIKQLEDKEQTIEKKNSDINQTKLNEDLKSTLTNEEKNQVNGENNSKQITSKGTEVEILTTKENLTVLPCESDCTKGPDKESNTEVSSKLEREIPSENLSISTTAAKNPTSQQELANKMSVLESLKKELRESKQKLLEKKSTSAGESCNVQVPSPAIYNRKRRLTDQIQTTATRPLNSESEIDLNSENPEEVPNDQELKEDDDMDIGGKRLKMRPKQTNAELRKKIEAQKVAANDETTSSSGGEEELRRRKRIILPKTPTVSPPTKQDEIELQSSKDDLVKTDKSNEIPIKALTPQQQIPIKKQITPPKSKPTLAEIIEKKLKKTPEKIEKDSTALESCGGSSNTLESATAKSLFPSPNKNPITKPLKKNLLTQIRQEGSDEDAVPRKRTNSQESNSFISSDIKILEVTTANTIDVKPIVSKVKVDKQRITPERQRKRRSSEETVQNESAEEPEAKKEVTVAANDKEVNAKRDKTNDSIKEEDTIPEIKDVEIKKEHETPAPGRRSGRRSGAVPMYVETLQTKRNRASMKGQIKKDLNDCDKVEKIKEETSNKEKKIVLKEEVKHEIKNDKLPDNKITTKDDVNKDLKTESKTNSSSTVAVNEVVKPKTSPVVKTPAKGVRKQRDVDTTNIIDENETPVRQSRRIAQQKIREEAERRKLEEIALRTMKQELKKKKKAEKQSDPTVVPPTEPSSESEESDVETKRKIQKKKCPGKNGNWSSGSEEQEEPDEEDEEPPHYETDPGSPLFKSDHEFSPESDLEDESQVVPMKRARTVRKEDAGEDAGQEEEACQKCNKSDHPEWILLCDNCDKGYHCSCLSPVLFYIPEGDWYCPPCQQEQLIKALESQLKEFDDLIENKRKEEEEVKRLAEEERVRQEKEEESKKRKNKKDRATNSKRNNDNSSVEDHSNDSDDNETSTNSDDSRNKQSAKNKNKNRCRNSKNTDKRNHRDRRQNATRGRRNRLKNFISESDSGSQNSKSGSRSNSSSSSSTYSESDNEPIYKLRKRRQINVSYRLNEYDDLINSALKKEMDEAAGAGNLGRGKDITTIIEADKEEKEKARQKQVDDEDEDVAEKSKNEADNKESVVKKEPEESAIKTESKEITKDKIEEEEDDSDAEPISRKFNIKPSQKKKSRKLTTLDISSEDDDGSDEDFKGSSFDDDEEEDTSISASNSDSSLEIYKRHGKPKKKRRKAARRAFRQRRKDRRFVVDESDDEEVQRPKSKKKRKDDSEYTESDVDDNSELSENIDSADLCDDTTTDESDGAWRPNKRKKTKKSSSSAQKSPKTQMTTQPKKPKKVEYSDDDISESEEDEDDDENDNVGSGKGMGKQPRSQPLKTSSSSTKTKGKGKEKPPTKTKKKKKSSEDDESKSGSEDSTRRTRGRRYAYIEDFDDDSSDGGIKPGVQRPDTPPEEREKFIKRQEEIKRMLAEKNAEGAKLAATPRLTPIKTDGEKDKRSPVKAGDSLSTVPLSVIRQAKVLDIDYLQRRGENLDDLNDVADVDDDFDDADLPDDLPDDMDEDAIARMVEEEEDFGATDTRDLPAPDEVLRAANIVKTIKPKEAERPNIPVSAPSTFPTSTAPAGASTTPATASGLQEPVRKRLPMPTMHPPLLRHQFLMHESMANAHHLMQRHGGAHTSHLLQNALSAPLTQPLERNYPPTTPSHHSLLNRMIHNLPLQPTSSQSLSAIRPSQTPPSSIGNKPSALINQPAQEKSANPQPATENKPRGRRKKITPLRDTLQKQQTAAAVTAATATNSALASAKNSDNTSLQSSVIKSGSPTKLPMQASVITSMPPTSHPASGRPTVNMNPMSGAYVRSDAPRFFDSPTSRIPQSGVPRIRGHPQMSPSLLPPHPTSRSTYGPPPPLKGAGSVPPVSSSSSSTGASARPMHHVPPYLGMPPNARHTPPPHLNMYRPPMYGNPNFGPRVNLRPGNILAPEYSAGSRAYPPYGFYPPPPPLTTPGPRSGHGPPLRPPPTQMSTVPSTLTQPPPASVIVSAAKSSNAPTATPQPTPPRTPEISEPRTSSKPVLATPELPNKVSAHIKPPSSPPSVAPQIEKPRIAAVPVAEPRKKLTTLEAYPSGSKAKKSPVQATGDSSGSRSSPGPHTEANDDRSTPGASDNTPTAEQTSRQDGQASEFSGLVSYFSSQHDDYNT